MTRESFGIRFYVIQAILDFIFIALKRKKYHFDFFFCNLKWSNSDTIFGAQFLDHLAYNRRESHKRHNVASDRTGEIWNLTSEHFLISIRPN